MKISNSNTNSFGQLKIALKAKEIMGYELHKKSLMGDNAFIDTFRAMLKNCEDTQYADLLVTKTGNVFVQDKLSKNKKQINCFNSLVNSVFMGLKHVIFAEENRFHF